MYVLLSFLSAFCMSMSTCLFHLAILVPEAKPQAGAALTNCSASLCSAMAMLEDLSTFRDDEDGMDIDDTEDEVDETDEPMLPLPVGAAGAVCARSISLSSLWPCASVISSAETDDLSICHRASASSSSCAQSANQFGVRLESDSHLPTTSAVSPARYISLDMVFPATRDQIITWHPNRVLFAIIIFSNDCHKVLLFVADVEASSQMPCRPWRIGWRSAALQRHANSRLRIEVPDATCIGELFPFSLEVQSVP